MDELKDLQKYIQFFYEIDKLKSVYRYNELLDKSRRENAAEHSWHLCVMAIMLEQYSTYNVDMFKVIKMLLIHDMVEIYAGDTYAFSIYENNSKRVREEAAMKKITTFLPEEKAYEIKKLWLEYDNSDSKEAIYALAVDRLQPFLLDFRLGGKTWDIMNGKITKTQMLERLNIIKAVFPSIWDYVMKMIEEACRHDWLQNY